jgi:hydroxyacylglutathione hydrolase
MLCAGVAAAVDPVDADKVYAEAKQRGVRIDTVLTTHSHWDHAGGNESLVELVAKEEQRTLQVIGGNDDGVPSVTREVGHGDSVQVGSLSVSVFHTPCHTRGHVLYLCDGALFTGDTLFVAGCGRFFVGTPDEMHYALNEVVAKLPPATQIYCGHEYTVSNLRFAAHVEPQNQAIQKKLAWAIERTTAELPTIPSTVAEELETNPFMRVQQPAVQVFASGAQDPVEVMRVLRTTKDSFGVGKGKI